MSVEVHLDKLQHSASVLGIECHDAGVVGVFKSVGNKAGPLLVGGHVVNEEWSLRQVGEADAKGVRR
jgi:hypothetical protein